jgi:hypothetical protein
MQNSDESLVGTLPPPRKTDVLFGAGVDWQANACVKGIDNGMAYQDGYRHAARHLAEYVCDTGQGQDFLVYPIVFLYRHHIELTLKSIIGVSISLLDCTLSEKDHDTLCRHDLAKLWNMARPLLNPICELGGSSALPSNDLKGIDSYIAQLHKYDRNGESFRYATNKPKSLKTIGAPSLPPDLKHINIRDFALALEKLPDYLDALDMWFGDLIEAKCQFQRMNE